MQTNTPYAADFWIGFTFDYPAYEPSHPDSGFPAHPAGRGLCVAHDGTVLLRLPDGSHVARCATDLRLVAEVPRVVPAEPEYEYRATDVREHADGSVTYRLRRLGAVGAVGAP